MNKTVEITETYREKQIRKSISDWLKQDKWNFKDLRSWIKGYKFIAANPEPYVWIIKSLFSYTELKNKLALRLAEFLAKEKPYQKARMTDDDDDILFYNLFYLSAGLNHGQELGAELLKIFNYFQENSEERDDFFSKTKWYNLNVAFRESLISNQINDSLKEIWQAGLLKKQISFLTIDRYSSFRGIIKLQRADNSHEPDIHAIGEGLKIMADHFENKSERGRKFRGLIEQTKDTWKDYQNWNKSFLYLSYQYEWQDWAITKLDSLVQPLDEFTGDLQHFVVWDLYLPFLQKKELIDAGQTKRCGEITYKIEAPKGAIRFLKDSTEIKEAETARLLCPFPDYKAICLASNEPFNRSKDFSVNMARIENIASSHPTPQQEKVEEVLQHMVANA